ncbi:hypothetical protein H705_00922 [Bartonella bacilliformis Cond044]|nr:hypothetical protein H705_00922 [Bartonella bacilliformis Cond044]
MREKIISYQQRLQKIQIGKFNTPSSNKLFNELREETKELAATLATQIALKEGKNSPINALTQNSKSKNDLASRIREKISYAQKTPL